MKKTALFSILVIFLLVPLTLFFGSKIRGRWYYLTCTLVMIETMLPFFFSFEARKPRPRELVMIAVMAALAAVSRIAFAFIPYFRPIIGIIMISGIAFGAEAGFLTGAIGVFASNFFYSQGPWTPWQMFAYGFAGFLAGSVFYKHRTWCKPWILAPFGFLSLLLIVGPILDTCSVFTMLTKLTKASVLLIYGQGIPVNIAHGVACAVTLVLFGPPLLKKLDRLKLKYGMMEGRS